MLGKTGMIFPRCSHNAAAEASHAAMIRRSQWSLLVWSCQRVCASPRTRPLHSSGQGESSTPNKRQYLDYKFTGQSRSVACSRLICLPERAALAVGTLLPKQAVLAQDMLLPATTAPSNGRLHHCRASDSSHVAPQLVSILLKLSPIPSRAGKAAGS